MNLSSAFGPAPGRREIMLVDDDPGFVWIMRNVLEKAGYGVTSAQDGEKALEVLDGRAFDLVLLDSRMPKKDGVSVARAIKDRLPGLPMIMITGFADVVSAVRAMKAGVYDYITKPVDNQDLLYTIERALEKRKLIQEVTHLRTILDRRASLADLMGKSDDIAKLLASVEKVAPTSFTVLVEGESGTGKELVAHAIHDLSAVSKGPMVEIDCGAIPDTLVESEMFGHMKGSFSGAHADKPGQFELAHGGTLFLDEVSNLPLLAQQKLLRAIQERRIQRLGSKKSISVDVRIVAATNRPLEADAEAGEFREDLYFRLKEFSIRVPPLRERKEDVPFLANRFMKEVQVELGKRCGGISAEALARMDAYPWPGNVRELRNVIRQAVLLCPENDPIQAGHLMLKKNAVFPGDPEPSVVLPIPVLQHGSLRQAVDRCIEEVERRCILGTLDRTRGNKSAAARSLAIDYKTLLRKIRKYSIV